MGVLIFWLVISFIVFIDIQKYDVKPSVKAFWVILTFLFGIFSLIGYLIVSRNWKKYPILQLKMK
jgi:hypothetical protein